jgi:hypothetical protein
VSLDGQCQRLLERLAEEGHDPLRVRRKPERGKRFCGNQAPEGLRRADEGDETMTQPGPHGLLGAPLQRGQGR